MKQTEVSQIDHSYNDAPARSRDRMYYHHNATTVLLEAVAADSISTMEELEGWLPRDHIDKSTHQQPHHARSASMEQFLQNILTEALELLEDDDEE